MNTLLRRSLRCLIASVLFGGLVLPTLQPAEAQLLDRIKNRIKNDAERRVEERAVAAARHALDLAEDAIVCVVTDRECIDDARRRGREPVVVDENGKPVSGYTPAGGAPADGVWANFDFVPGDDVLFYHDFEGTRTGNFPSRLELIGGNMEVVEVGGNKALRTTAGSGCFEIPVGRVLPERYTVEFRMRTSDPLARLSVHLLSGASELVHGCHYPPLPHALVTGYQGAGLKWDGGEAMGDTYKALFTNTWADVRIAVDGPYWKMYVNEKRVANVPRFAFPAAASLNLIFGVYLEDLFIDDLRIAGGGPRSLYDDLMSVGFISTTAIRFDTGSDRIKPESSGILNDIVDLLEDYPDVRLVIEGHTDSDGADAYNQSLSERRAAAVEAWLAGHGIENRRLDTTGYGEHRPVTDNGTPEGMARNRRVVFRRR